ncbi:hypothetical protein CLOBOL_00208 [Enterocloster bolteae ATCC BAA-613]|nr:hypothetical protein CLOBOL_00208 [Enterocloster bolteae ATCC BAA-613]
MYGNRLVKHEALKRWVKTISLDNINTVDIGGELLELTEKSKKILDIQIALFSKLVESMKPGDDWRALQNVLSPLFYNAFFRVGNNAIRIANYYECMVIPSNMKTYKKIIKGVDYQEIGSVKLYDGKRCIGEIGAKSDLMWSVFYDYFINIGKWGEITHTHTNHERYLSIQLFDIEFLSNDEICRMINEILLKVSMEHDLDFSVVEMDAIYKLEGEAKTYGIQFHSLEFEYIPALYLINALNTREARLAYLSYYQVLEYFFVRAQNYYFLNEYGALSMPAVNHNELRKVLHKYKNILNERESLKLVLTRSLDISKFKSWILQDKNRVNKYCNSQKNSIDITKSDEKIVGRLGERIYSMRCSIAHAKGDVDEYIAVPTVSDSEISLEIELIKYAAYEALKACSEIK